MADSESMTRSSANERDDKGNLRYKQLLDRITVLSICPSFARVSIDEVDRFIHLASISSIVESSNARKDYSYHSRGAGTTQAANTSEHCGREEKAESDCDEEACIDHVGNGGELVNLGPAGALCGVGIDSSALIVG